MTFPKEMLEIVSSASQKYHTDIHKAVDLAESNIRRLPNYAEIVSILIRHAIMELVYDYRHRGNVEQKGMRSEYGGPAKVAVGLSDSVRRSHESLYHLKIAGTVLGLIQGGRLKDLAQAEYAIGDGHYVNAYLLESLSRIVPSDKSVRECVSETKLAAMLKAEFDNLVGQKAQKNMPVR